MEVNMPSFSDLFSPKYYADLIRYYLTPSNPTTPDTSKGKPKGTSDDSTGRVDSSVGEDSTQQIMSGYDKLRKNQVSIGTSMEEEDSLETTIIRKENKRELMKKVNKQLNTYTTAVTAVHLMDKKTKGEAVSAHEFNTILQEYKSFEEVSFARIVDRIINHPVKNDKILQEKDKFVVHFGNMIYQVEVKSVRKPTDGKVSSAIQILQTFEEKSDGGIDMKILKDSPIITITSNASKEDAQAACVAANTDDILYQVGVGREVVFVNGSRKPTELQIEAISKFSDNIGEGNPKCLEVLGTGVGKSYIIAGIAQASSVSTYDEQSKSDTPTQTVMILPNINLAKESLKDALIPKEKIYLSKPGDIDKFEDQLRDPGKLIVLLADDPEFHQKSERIKNRVVLMDESHEHTFNEKDLNNLMYLSENNVMLGLTGTPTSQLFRVLGESVMTYDVRWAMDHGHIRQCCLETDATALDDEDLIRKAVLAYFGRDEYLEKGPGVESIDETKRNIKVLKTTFSDKTEEEIEIIAIDNAIKKNRLHGIEQKNFLFNGDNKFRETVLNAYEKIVKGQYNPAKLIDLQEEIADMRKEKEVEARVKIIQALHPEKMAEDIRVVVASAVDKPRVDLKQEALAGQKKQIADTINAHALKILLTDDKDIYKNTKVEDIEKIMRTGDFNPQEYGAKLVKKSDEFIEESLKNIAPKLQDPQRSAYIAQIKSVVESLQNHIPQKNIDDGLAQSDEIQLDKLHASYTSDTSELEKFQLQKETTKRFNAYVLQLFDPTLTFGQCEAILSSPDREMKLKKLADNPINTNKLLKFQDDFIKEEISEEAIENRMRLLTDTANKFKKNQGMESVLLATDQMNLGSLGIEYAANQLDQLRTGLIMHLGSDRTLSTGISIQSVLSVQQIIKTEDDDLNDPLYATQAFGRAVRNKDRAALLYQGVKSGVKRFVKLPEILAKDSLTVLKPYFDEPIKHNLKKFEEIDLPAGISPEEFEKFADREEVLVRETSDYGATMYGNEEKSATAEPASATGPVQEENIDYRHAMERIKGEQDQLPQPAAKQTDQGPRRHSI